MVCWNCQARSEFGNETIRYCPQCGVRLMQECVYCNSEISCDENECPRCGRSFSQCVPCHIFYALDQEICTECSQSLSNVCDRFLPYGVNGQKDNCLVINKRADFKSTHINAEMSEIAVNNKYGYFWKKLGENTARLSCQNFATGASAWKETEVPSYGLRIQDILYFEINEAYLVTCLPNKVLIHSLIDGGLVNAILLNYKDYRACVRNKKLFVIGALGGMQVIEAHGIFSGTVKILSEAQMGLDQNTSIAPPVFDDRFVYFADFRGSICKLDPETDNVEFPYLVADTCVDYMVLHNNHLVFSRKLSASTYTIIKINLADGRDTILSHSINLSCAKLSVYKNYIYFCENLNGEIRFASYPIFGTNWRADHASMIRKTSDVRDYYMVVHEAAIFFVYISKSYNANSYEAYRLDFNTGVYERLRPLAPNVRHCIVNVYNNIVIVEQNKGLIFSKAL